LIRKTNIKTCKEGKIFISPTTGYEYKVYKWKVLSDGKIEAMKKERVK